MPQLLAHLIGDYVLQSHVMATRKTSSWPWALTHALFYGLPFLLLVSHAWQWAVIVGTHAVIDRYRLAGYWCRWWGVGFPGVWDRIRFALYDRFGDGADQPFESPPPFLGVWLLILVDNTMHLTINYLTLAVK